jgi:hypothetical protein
VSEEKRKEEKGDFYFYLYCMVDAREANEK